MEGDRDEFYSQRIAELPPLQRVMLDLDVAVTGVPAARAVRQYHHYPKDLEDWYRQTSGGNPEWYLSDAGYSRVVWSEERRELFLTSNSTSTAKANWERALPQRQAADAYIRQELDRLLGQQESRAQTIVDILLETSVVEGKRGPSMKVLKANRKTLDPDERSMVMRHRAVWHNGPNGKPSPAVWKAEVRGKNWYVCATHRYAAVKPTLRAAIKAFPYVKTTA